MSTEAARYWDDVAKAWRAERPQRLWREYSDRMNDRLLRPWLAERPRRRLLKTDLFDEAVGELGLVRPLADSARSLYGIDLSRTVAHTAAARHGAFRVVRADVRRLPFAGGSFDVVVSNSTLDHFASLDDVSCALEEIHRVLEPRGELLLTLDNLMNPFVAARAVLPARLLHALRLVPYRVGKTCGPARLRRLLRSAGFEVESLHAAMHCPRILAVWLGHVLDRSARAETKARFLELLLACERLERLPTRYLTGYFLAVKAVRG